MTWFGLKVESSLLELKDESKVEESRMAAVTDLQYDIGEPRLPQFFFYFICYIYLNYLFIYYYIIYFYIIILFTLIF